MIMLNYRHNNLCSKGRSARFLPSLCGSPLFCCFAQTCIISLLFLECQFMLLGLFPILLNHRRNIGPQIRVAWQYDAPVRHLIAILTFSISRGPLWNVVLDSPPNFPFENQMAQPRSFTAGQNDFLLFFTLAFLIFFVITLRCVGIRFRNLVY